MQIYTAKTSGKGWTETDHFECVQMVLYHYDAPVGVETIYNYYSDGPMGTPTDRETIIKTEGNDYPPGGQHALDGFRAFIREWAENRFSEFNEAEDVYHTLTDGLDLSSFIRIEV